VALACALVRPRAVIAVKRGFSKSRVLVWLKLHGIDPRSFNQSCYVDMEGPSRVRQSAVKQPEQGRDKWV
jgi:hypothetical protein